MHVPAQFAQAPQSRVHLLQLCRLQSEQTSSDSALYPHPPPNTNLCVLRSRINGVGRVAEVLSCDVSPLRPRPCRDGQTSQPAELPRPIQLRRMRGRDMLVLHQKRTE